MKYANEARAEGVPVRTGEILYEAMPWLKQVTGKTIVCLLYTSPSPRD